MLITHCAASDKGEGLFYPALDGHAPTDDESVRKKLDPWKVMVIDDDDAVHQVTVMVLADYDFEGRPVEIVQGYSGGACRHLMKKHPDTAVLLLDVVMETDAAGLEAVKYIREVLNNKLVRIIVRTGQPGHMQEEDVFSKYDINGYEAKTEFTAQKLFTCLTTSLRTYCDLLNAK